jgi:hypothetical protein
MFEMVIGGLDVILERLEKKESIEKSLYKIMLESQNEEDIRRKMDTLGQSLNTIQREVADEVPLITKLGLHKGGR